uniref:Putative secreted protein n=1 Tax=Amblyomma triste TaxID=251400 RepID=A0A023G3A8_AMBTT
MRWTALFALILTIGGTAYEYVPCGQYPTTITSLDHATCIPEHFFGYADHNYVPWSHGSNCTSTVDVYTSCTCQDGNGVTGHNYCVYNVSRTLDDNTANVTIGLCGVGGRCYVYDFKAFMEVDLRNLQLAKRLNMFPLPPCVAPDLEVVAGIKVAAGCEFFCYGRQNKDINDGRICALEWYSGAISGEPIVTLTGSCHNGICRTSGLYDFPMQGKCHDSERYQHYGALLDKCTYKCPNGSEMQRPDFLACLFRKNLLRRETCLVCA